MRMPYERACLLRGGAAWMPRLWQLCRNVAVVKLRDWGVVRLSFGISTSSCRSVSLIEVANSDLTTCLIRVGGDVTS